MRVEAVLIVAVLVLCFAMVSGLVQRYLPAPALVFVVIGMALGPSGLGLVEVSADRADFVVLAELALTVILFGQASKLELGSLFRREHLSLRLLGVGIPVTVALGTFTAVLVFPALPFWEAVCLAVIVAPTEIALIEALLEDRRIPDRVRGALSLESGCYDGIALAVLLAAVALASEYADPAEGHWAWFAFRMEVVSLTVGVAIGVLGGAAVAFTRRRGWMNGTWAQLVTVALAVVCFAVGEEVDGSGFVTAFAGGLAYTVTAAKHGNDAEDTNEVSDATAQVLELVVFALLGALAVVPAWRDADWRVILFAALALAAVRMAAVSIAVARTGMTTCITLFMGWFGPRGIGTLILALVALEEGAIQNTDVIFQVAVVVVTLSLVLHSVTAAWANRAAGLQGAPAQTRPNRQKGTPSPDSEAH